MDREVEGLAEMNEASRLKVTDEHNVIDEAIQDKGQGYTVFSIVRPVPLLLATIQLTTRDSLWGFFTVPRRTR